MPGAVALHVVLDGEANVLHPRAGSPDPRPRVSTSAKSASIDSMPRSATVTAGDSLRTLYVPHASFTGLVENDPAVAKELLVTLCGRIRQIESEAISN